MNLIAMELQPQVPENAPGRGETTQPSQPPPGVPPAGGPGAGGGMPGGWTMLMMFLPMVLVILFLNRSQGKKQRELESKLKKGDRVLTASGMVGRIAELGTKYVKLELAPGVKVQMLKSSIQGLDPGDEPSTAAKDSKGKNEASDKDLSTETKK